MFMFTVSYNLRKTQGKTKDFGMSTLGFAKHMAADIFISDSSPFARFLDSCIRSKSARDICQVHARIATSRFSSEIFIQNKLIDAYGKCGYLEEARKVFDEMPDRNVFSWNSLISALTKVGFLEEADRTFRSIPEPDQCSWNSMISGFAQHNYNYEALDYFVRMHRNDFVMNQFSFGSALSACAALKYLKMGCQIHSLISKSSDSSNVYIGSALVDMYSKSGDVVFAQRVFDGMTLRNRVSWNCMITCYEQCGPADVALRVFVEMMDCGFKPDEVTLASVVSACATLSMVKEGSQVHAQVVKCDKLRDDLILSNALVDMYAKGKKLDKARLVFDRMPVRNVVSETSLVSGYAKATSIKAARLMFMKMAERNAVSWNALIAGYTQNGDNEEALSLFRLLKKESVWPTHYTFGNLLNACANLADLRLGRQAHSHVFKHGFWFQNGEDSDIFVGNSLIDMYMKSGSIQDGLNVFEKMTEKDRVSWNAIIVGYAQNGYGNQALEVFHKMLEFGEKPDNVTMIGVLSACSHAGLLDEGRHYFHSMTVEYGVIPLKDHYTCMVDILGRAGCLHEAKELIEEMPMSADSAVWGSLLAACKVHRNIMLGEYVAKKLLDIDPGSSGPYVLLSNMYAELKKWRDVGRVRKLMRQRGVVKQPGCSWIEVDGLANVFLVKDKTHSCKEEIYSTLAILLLQMKQSGYVPRGDEACEELSKA